MSKTISEAVNMTWYDAREAHPTRTEYRLYYFENSVIRRARVNDLLVVGKLDNNSLVVLIVKNQCEYYRLFMRMFGLNYPTPSYVILNNIAI